MAIAHNITKKYKIVEENQRNGNVENIKEEAIESNQ